MKRGFKMSKKRGNFSSGLGFVMAAAGSAVGLGNIWRFPYLAAKDGGGLFLVVYIALALTFGFALLTTELAIGRKTKQSPLTAYGVLRPKWKFLGVIASIVPVIILPYYCTIGGWVFKYLFTFVKGDIAETVGENYFMGFLGDNWSPIIFFVIFLVATAAIVIAGVDKGIERFSKILMPALLVLIIGISIYSLTLTHEDADGTIRTGLDGLKRYIIPSLENVTVGTIFTVLTDAVGQLFFSISVAMGIMVTYGSYVKKDMNLMQSINRIEFFDTLVAFLAGLMIIPAVYVFMGQEGMASAGPGLMFISLPKVFNAMGTAGTVFGIIFFIMVSFAAITSSVSILEAIVSSIMDRFKVKRIKAVLITVGFTLVVGVLVCMGYNRLFFDITLPNGASAQLLDIMDYASNNILMPLVALLTCIMVGWMLKPMAIIDEVTLNGEKFGRKSLYVVMVKFIAPILLLVLMLQSLGVIRLG